MARSEAGALALWFQQRAAEEGSGGLVHTSSVRWDRWLLGEAADSADHLMVDDERLVRLDAAQRFTDFYGELLFVRRPGHPRREAGISIGDAEATGHTVLQAVITAALSESAPA